MIQTINRLEFIKAIKDPMFKAVFCNEKNRDILRRLIEDTIGKKVEINALLMQDIPKENIEVKDKTLDVLVSADGEKINIELNISHYEGLNNRNACYIFSKYSTSVKPGKNYKNMDNFIQINLTCGLPKKKPNVSKYELVDINTKEKFIKNLTIYEFNLDKIKELCYNEEEKKQYKILAALVCNQKELHEICKGDNLLEKLESEVIRMNEDEQIRENLLAIENAKIVHDTLIANAEEKGIQQGITQEKIQIAKSMLNKNMDIDTIVEITNLTKEKIEKLK